MMYLNDLRCQESRKKIAALGHIELIAAHLDLGRTVSELLPFLMEFQDEEEDVLLAFCEALDVLEKFINRRRGDASELIPCFFVALSSEDSSVSQAAIKSLGHVARVTRFDGLFELAVSLLKYKSDMSSISAIRIFCRFIDYIPEKRYEQIAEIIKEVANSDRILIRAELAKELQALIVEAGQLEKSAIETLKKLTQDPQETVVVATTQCWCSLSVSRPYFFNVVFPVLETLINFQSWRVRYTIVCGFPNIIVKAFPSEKSSEIMDHLIGYIKDPEIEVSIKAIEVLKEITQYITHQELDTLIPALRGIIDRVNFDTRLSIAKSLPALASVELRENLTVYLEMVSKLLNDSNPEIPMELLSNFEPIWNNFHNSKLWEITSSILINLLRNELWTIRKQAVLSIEKISQKLGEAFASDPILTAGITERLSDKVFDIRDQTIALLKSLSTHFGRDYAEKIALPIFKNFQDHKNYLYRINYLKGISALSRLMSIKTIIKEVPKIEALCSDKVPNVRQQALACLQRIFSTRNDPAINEAVRRVTGLLSSDFDSEVLAEREKLITSIKADTSLEEE